MKLYGQQLLDIQEITLLSEKEAMTFLTKKQRAIGSWWWLRSPGQYPTCAAYVNIYGKVITTDNYVNNDLAVRPALRIPNLSSNNLKIRDIFEVGGESWKVISEDLALCNNIIGRTAFKEDYKAHNANVYEKSDVKQWLENWALERKICQGCKCKYIKHKSNSQHSRDEER